MKPRTSTRHRWGEPLRETHLTERVCRHCGMLKITHHDGGFPWTEFRHRQREGLAMRVWRSPARTPICSPVARAA